MWPWRKNTHEVTPPRRSPPTPRCLACHTAFRQTLPETCPRCGADNRAWWAWQGAGWRPQLKRFFLYSPWGWLALLSLLLPLVSGGFFDFKPPLWEALILALSLLLSVGGLLFFFLERDRLWLGELVRQTAPRGNGLQGILGGGLLTWGGVGFLLFVMAGGGLLAGSPGGEGGGLIAWLALLTGGLAFTAQTWAAGAYTLFAYGRWCWRTFPRPIFVNEARFLALVAAEARLRIQLKLRQYEKLTMQVASVERTRRAEITLNVQVSWSTDEVYEGHFLTAVQPWRVVSNLWGHVKQLTPVGPVTYVPDVARPYASSEASEAPEAAETVEEAVDQPSSEASATPEAPQTSSPSIPPNPPEGGIQPSPPGTDAFEKPEAAETPEEAVNEPSPEASQTPSPPAPEPPGTEASDMPEEEAVNQSSSGASIAPEPFQTPSPPSPTPEPLGAEASERPEAAKPRPPKPPKSSKPEVLGPEPAEPALEGELILDESVTPATIEDAIILAIVATSYRREDNY